MAQVLRFCLRLQLDLCQLLQDGRGWVTAVGDNNQQIMTFAQAVPDIFHLFSRLFDARQHTLTINYRWGSPCLFRSAAVVVSL